MPGKKSGDPFIIYGYFNLQWNTIDELKLLDKPKQILNLDETSFCLDASKTRAVGAKNVVATSVTQGFGRENTSVLMSCSAAGEKGLPLNIYKRKSVQNKWGCEKSNFPGTTYAATENGRMKKQAYINYF